jgi:hypothetical protein
MQAAWNPVDSFDQMATDLVQDQAQILTPNSSTCTLQSGACTNAAQLTLKPYGAEATGDLDLFSTLNLGYTSDYEFPAADLVNGAGKAVGPTETSVEAAVNDMETNPDGITQYANDSSSNKDPNAYPLALVDYAMVPTCGLSSAKASAISKFLTTVATTGQKPGSAPGDLAGGYYPLNSKQRAQTLLAAKEVKEQDCKSAPPDKTVSGETGANDVATGKISGGGSGAAGTGAGGSGKSGKSAKTGSSAGSSASSGANPTVKTGTVAFGQKSPDSGLAGLLLLLAVIAGAVVLVGGPAAWALTATGKWPVVVGWVRPAWTWVPPARARLRAIRIWRR